MAKTRRPLTLPALGVIRGGRLAGWRYRFLRFQVARIVMGGHPMPELQVYAMCTPPNWPFPCDIPLKPEYYLGFRAVPGDRAKRIQAEPLIAEAFLAAGLPAPSWLASTEPITLRRAAVLSWRANL